MSSRLNLLIYFLKKDIKSRYAGSGLGLLWTIILPLIQVLLFWFVFAGIMKARPYADTNMPYIYFLLSSFFFWLAFSEGLMRAASSILDNSEIVKKVAFPNMVLPVTVTLSSYVQHLIGFVIFIIVFLLTTSFSPAIILVIPVVFLQLLFSLGLSMLFSALMPYIRDLGQILGPVLQGAFFLSPIMYSLESAPERFKIIFYLNPLTYFITSYHKIILMHEMPSMMNIGIMTLISLSSFIGGLYSFRKLKDGFADVL